MKTRKEILEHLKYCEDKVQHLYRKKELYSLTSLDLKRIDSQISKLENYIIAFKYVLI